MKRLLALFTLFLSLAAVADTDGSYGELVDLEVVTLSSDLSGIERGKLTLREDGIDQVYYWGGNRCLGRNLTEAEIGLLQNALLAPYIRVLLSYQPGQGGSRCVVRLKFTNEKFLAPQ